MKRFYLSFIALMAAIPCAFAQSASGDALTKNVLIFVIAVLVIYFVVSKSRMFMSIVRAISGAFRTSKKNPHTTDQQRKILLGAVYSLQQDAYLDTLKLDIGSSKRNTILQDWWGIHGKDSAFETLDYLRDKGHRYYFPTVLEMMKMDSADAQRELVRSRMQNQEDAEKTISSFNNLMASIDALKKEGTITSEADIERVGVVGWDVGRLSFMTRLCYEAKYLTEDEAWSYLDAADRIAHEGLGSWKDLADSYVLGRYFWTGVDGNSSVIRVYANDLLNKPKSPWTVIPF